MLSTVTIQALISTTLSRLNDAIKLAKTINETSDVKALIICQTFEDKDFYAVNQPLSDIQIIYSKEKGLSNSRQLGIVSSTADVIWFLDDDVSININGINDVRSLFIEKEVDIITTKFDLTSGGYKKNYKNVSFVHDFYSVLKVSSIETFCRRNFLIKNSIMFDSSFGLGAKYPSGEENIFLSDCLKKKAIIKYFPIVTSTHPPITSGDNYVDRNLLIAKGALIKRLFGSKGIFIIVPFIIKQMNKKSTEVKPLLTFWLMLTGFLKYKNKTDKS